jgi:tetratricopeptide (TPR) repeat protein
MLVTSAAQWLCAAAPSAKPSDAILERLSSPVPMDFDEAVAEIRSKLAAQPGETVKRLNGGWLKALLRAGHWAEVEELAMAGSVRVASETFQVEQLQGFRVGALRAAGKHREALSAAKGLYNVSGLGSTRSAMQLVGECLKAAYPDEPGIVHRFKLQQLAGAQTDPEKREQAMKGLGEPILAGIAIDPAPWAEAIERQKKTLTLPSPGVPGEGSYRKLYGLGNLLLLAGRTQEAREVFERVHRMAEPEEFYYASEGLAKAIKAEDGLGPMNQWIASLREKP